MSQTVEIAFTYAQAVALRDLVEFRLGSGPTDPGSVPEPEVDEIYALVGALVKLNNALDQNR